MEGCAEWCKVVHGAVCHGVWAEVDCEGGVDWCGGGVWWWWVVVVCCGSLPCIVMTEN